MVYEVECIVSSYIYSIIILLYICFTNEVKVMLKYFIILLSVFVFVYIIDEIKYRD